MRTSRRYCVDAFATVIIFCRACSCLGLASTISFGATQNLPLLTNISAIKQLKGPEATRGYPVRIHGIVTFQNAVRDAVIHDSRDGIFIARSNANFDLVQGQFVEVRGVTGFEGYAPRVEAREIRVLGEGQLPAPRCLPFDWLTSGREDCQWVEVRGIVRTFRANATNDYYLDISVEGNRLRVCLLDGVVADCSRLVDSTVRVRGVLGSNRNSRRQILAPLLWASGTNLFVEEYAAQDPFAIPIRSASSLLRFEPGAVPNHRVRVRGTVTHQVPGSAVFIRDGAQGLWVQTAERRLLKPGEVIEVIGFEGMGKYSPVLQDATYRRVGEEPVPSPKAITEDEALRGEHDANLVTMEGQLLDSYQGGEDRILVLQARRTIFKAHLAQSSVQNSLPIPRSGGRLRLTGICLIDEVAQNVDKATPMLFRLLLRSPADIVVVQSPPWWTLSRLLWVLGCLALVTVAVTAWVFSLRRRVQLQTAVIAKKIQREAVLEERHRVAREIHDTLAQSYSGIGFQIESVAAQLPQESGVRQRLDLAKQMVRHGQEEFRRSLANLRAQELERGGLAEAIGECGRQMTAGSGVAFDVNITGATRGLDEAVENNLLRIAQECITNAMRHGKARRISASLNFEQGQVELRVSDDGAGFDTRRLEQLDHGHFGWRGIRERAEQIQATVNLTSQTGRGTTVIVTAAA